MSIYSTGIDPLLQTIINTSNTLSNYTSTTSNNLINYMNNAGNVSYNYTSNTSNTLINNITGIKQLIDGTSNTKIDSTGLQVYHKDIIIPLNSGWVNVDNRLTQNTDNITTINSEIAGINDTLVTIGGKIVTVDGIVAQNTADLITANAAIAANGIITGTNTLAIAGQTIAIATCLKNSMLGSGDICLYDAGNVLNLVFNNTHFYDKPVIGFNREFNLTSIYANLPTTKNDVITWSSPLVYNTGTDTASIDLSSYYTSTQTNTAINSNLNYYVSTNTLNSLNLINSNTVNNLYISSNSLFNYVIPNYTTNISLSNQLYISSNGVKNLYISSNSFFSSLIPNYVTNTSLSNQFYVSSNVLSNILLNYTTSSFLSNQLYVSSNVLSNILLNYTTSSFLSNQLYVSSNVLSNILLNYTTNTSLSNQLYISSNVFSNVLLNYPTNTVLSNFLYISSNVVTKILLNYNTISTDVILMNYTSNYISNLTQQTSNNFQYYPLTSFCSNTFITSNTFSTNINSINTNIQNNSNLLQYYPLTSSCSNTFITSNTFSTNINSINTAINNHSTLIQTNSNQFQNYYNSSTTNNLYISSNNFYRGSNIFLEKPVQILTNISSYTPKNALMVGDGGRLLINQEGTGDPYACSRIGTADTLSSGNFTSNANITLYEAGFIAYNAGSNVAGIGHNFNNSVQTRDLFVNGTITATGNISGNSIVATYINASNIGVKTPITFTTGTRTTTIGGDIYYLYDIDLRKYTKQIKLGSYNYRQFRARTWESDGDFEYLGYLSQNKYEIFMSDKNGLSIRSFSYYDNQDLSLLNVIVGHTLFRNSFNFMTYASRLSVATVYMIIEDLL